MQNTSRFYLTAVRITKVKKTTNDDFDVGKGKPSLLAEVGNWEETRVVMVTYLPSLHVPCVCDFRDDHLLLYKQPVCAKDLKRAHGDVLL